MGDQTESAGKIVQVGLSRRIVATRWLRNPGSAAGELTALLEGLVAVGWTVADQELKMIIPVDGATPFIWGEATVTREPLFTCVGSSETTTFKLIDTQKEEAAS